MPQRLEYSEQSSERNALILFAPPRAQMQRSQVQLLSTMVEELAFAGAPRPALAPLTALRSELSKRDPSYFNDAENFKDSTAEALDVQREARGSPLLWPARIAVLMSQSLSPRRFSCCLQKRHRGRRAMPRRPLLLPRRSCTSR